LRYIREMYVCTCKIIAHAVTKQIWDKKKINVANLLAKARAWL